MSSWIQTEVISLKAHNSMNKLKLFLWFNISVGREIGKGQLISEWLFDVIDVQKTNEIFCQISVQESKIERNFQIDFDYPYYNILILEILFRAFKQYLRFCQ